MRSPVGEGPNQASQFGRFLANPAVTTHEMLATAGRLTSQRVGGRHVLAIEDTSELHFPTHEASKRGFGKGGNGEDPGLFLHPFLAVDAANAGIIGLLDCLVLNRTAGKVTNRRGRTADEKDLHQPRRGGADHCGALDAAVLARDGSTGQQISDAVEPPALHGRNASLEGRTDKLKNPHDSSSLAWFVWIVARLGGWSGLYLQGLQSAGTKGHPSWPAPSRPHARGQAAGNSFRRCATPVACLRERSPRSGGRG